MENAPVRPGGVWVKIFVFVLCSLTGCQHSVATRERAAHELRQGEELRSDIQAVRAELDRLVEETAQLRGAIERWPGPIMDVGLLAMQSDLEWVSSAKLGVLETYMNMRAMPADNAAAGLPEPDRFRGRSLRSATVREGLIELEFDALSGKDGGRVWLIPEPAAVDWMTLQWRCETPDYVLIKRIAPLCDYVP
jgi:hypothetical protein